MSCCAAKVPPAATAQSKDVGASLISSDSRHTNKDNSHAPHPYCQGMDVAE